MNLETSLSVEMTAHIFSFLDPKTLGVCASVSKEFKVFSEDPQLWKTILQTFGMKNSEDLHPKEFFKKYCITEVEGISNGFNKFALSIIDDNVYRNPTKGNYTCHLLSHPDSKIEISLQPKKNNVYVENNYQSFYAKKLDFDYSKALQDNLKIQIATIEAFFKYKIESQLKLTTE